jgi:hypothetical protein
MYVLDYIVIYYTTLLYTILHSYILNYIVTHHNTLLHAALHCSYSRPERSLLSFINSCQTYLSTISLLYPFHFLVS